MAGVIALNGSSEGILDIHAHESMQILRHHLYEYQKGLRNLILYTTNVYSEEEVVSLLEKKGVSYLVRRASESKINVFFGDEMCINVLKNIGDKCLSEYTDEEDFILGIMLGYDRLQQCNRYLSRKNRSKIIEMLL
ncbi:DUF2023 family protein [uncultured Methanolobus sp.]|uniref:DUF2023 family protein n=1 Tax=uncultured Methanolobus sp. TaxID=218300 RepID=UPI002AABAEAA|nr:DUF2023 family protein [uncultured Methanolobus sp.]